MNSLFFKRNDTLIISIVSVLMIALMTFGEFGENKKFFISFYLVTFISINCAFAFCVFSFLKKNSKNQSQKSNLLEAVFAALCNIFIFSGVYRIIGINSSSGQTHDSFDCLYFSIVTWTTLGYGDFSPTESLRIVAATEALIGYIYMAILIGLFLVFFQSNFDNQNEIA